jgi:hypothetical protein
MGSSDMRDLLTDLLFATPPIFHRILPRIRTRLIQCLVVNVPKGLIQAMFVGQEQPCQPLGDGPLNYSSPCCHDYQQQLTADCSWSPQFTLAAAAAAPSCGQEDDAPADAGKGRASRCLSLTTRHGSVLSIQSIYVVGWSLQSYRMRGTVVCAQALAQCALHMFLCDCSCVSVRQYSMSHDTQQRQETLGRPRKRSLWHWMFRLYFRYLDLLSRHISAPYRLGMPVDSLLTCTSRACNCL